MCMARATPDKLAGIQYGFENGEFLALASMAGGQIPIDWYLIVVGKNGRNA